MLTAPTPEAMARAMELVRTHGGGPSGPESVAIDGYTFAWYDGDPGALDAIGDSIRATIAREIDAATERERERSAGIAERVSGSLLPVRECRVASGIAAEIRAAGTAPVRT